MSPSLLATLKTLHVVAAVLFVGNVIVTGVWAAIMFRARASHPFHVAARAIVITDWIFTFGGGALLVMTGVGLAMGRQFPIWGTPWIRHALIALMISITFVYSAVLGGLAGVLVGPILFVSIGMGSIIALKAFAATIIGGFGDVTGAIVGGLLLGVIESLAAYHISVPYKDAYAFLALFIFLLFRPSGIFGEKVSEKA